MNEPILKLHWERFTAHIDLDLTTAACLLAPAMDDPIDFLFLLSEGCANTNYKVTFKNGRAPVVIRIYVREKSALRREIGIHSWVHKKMPVPHVLYFDDRCITYSHPYAVMEWIEGKLMREMILTQDEKAITECACDAGKYLSELRKMRFSQGGFFQDDLSIRPFNQDETYLPFVSKLLQDEGVKESLGLNLHQAVDRLMIEHADLLPDENEANLTHGDYDPANLLVRKINDQWKIVGILDWEFAFAGTYLLDIGMMLRYSHKLPNNYEQNFIEGMETYGSPLPKQWKKQAKLMDLLCLLQLAYYNPQALRPRMNRDVVSLIEYIERHWNTF